LARWPRFPGRRRIRRPPAALLASALLPATGLWLAGYPGAIILPAATLLALAVARRGRPLGADQEPWLLAGLALAGTAVAAAGQHFLLTGHSGFVVTALVSAVPQVICLLIVACLIALLLRGGSRAGPPGRALAVIGLAWRTLSRDDPFWAICVDPEARGGGWDVTRFYATGAAEVEATLARARQLRLSASGARALDFGCGAGRLTRPLADRFDLVTGVDIAPEMLDLARRDNPAAGRCEFVLNDRPDLAALADGEFDLVYSSVVLQHLPRALIRAYLAELARVLRPGGSLIVQLPTRPRWTPRGVAYRCLPPAVLGVVQRRLLGYPAPMRMHGMGERRVRRLLAAHGVQVLAADPAAYHPDWHERRYFGRRLGLPPG
jgi:SAM-dependent methyltransferase